MRCQHHRIKPFSLKSSILSFTKPRIASDPVFERLAESFEACRISKLRRETSEIGISHKKIGMIDQK